MHERKKIVVSWRSWILLIYFFSGVCSLIDEVVWARLLKVTLGNTVYASSIVVSTFMAGLALGALVMRRRAGRVTHPLRLYAGLELCVTISALVLPIALRLADAGYRCLYIKWALSPGALTIVQIGVSAAIILVPAMLMGSTFPLLARYVMRTDQGIGLTVGKLYALNTLGAALGCFTAGLILIRSVGVMGALLVAAGINALVAASAYLLSSRHRCDPAPSDAMGSRTSARQSLLSGRHGLLLAGVFISGLVSIGYELVWMRSFVLKLGGWTYVFSSVLTVYLIGNVIGVAIGSKLTTWLKNPALGFGISLMCLGAFGVIFTPWLAWWLSLNTGALFGKSLESSMVLALVWPMFHATALFLLPSIAMGIGFPMALQAWGTHDRQVGKTTGLIYGVNTIGAVLGGVLTGFVLIPLMDTQRTVMILGILSVCVGTMVFQFFLTGPRRLARAIGLLAFAGSIILARNTPPDLLMERAAALPNYTTLQIREGVTTTAAVMRHNDTYLRVLASDGIMIAGEDEHRIAQQTLGHLGQLLHPNPRRVLSIGFGSGETTACMAAYELDRLDCVEIAPELVDLALEHFQDINLGGELGQYVNMIYMDGKNYLHLTDARYDVIVNGANIPTDAASAPMFTEDHFLAARNRLAPRGLFITKLHLADISRSHFDSILGTFSEAFPHVTVWFPITNPSIFFYLVGSREPQTYSPSSIQARLSSDNVRARLDILRIANSFDLLSCYVGDEHDIRKYLNDYHVNTDNFPFIEFSLDRTGLNIPTFVAEFLGKVRTNSIGRHIDWSGIDMLAREKWQAALRNYFRAATFVMANYSEQGSWKRLENCSDGLRLVPGHRALLAQETVTLMSMGDLLASDPNGDMRRAILAGARKRPDLGTAWLVRAWILRGMGNNQEAAASLKEALTLSPNSAMVYSTLGSMCFAGGDPEKGCAAFEQAVRLLPTEASFRFSLGIGKRSLGDLSGAISEYRQGLKHKPGALSERMVLAGMLSQIGNTADATEEYRVILEIDPENREATEALRRLVRP